MRGRRKWILGIAGAVPVLGIVLAYALPPIDEYASLDKIGTVVPTPDETSRISVAKYAGGQYKFDEPIKMGRRRSWKVPLPEGEAIRRVKNLVQRHPGWRDTGGTNLTITTAGTDENPVETENRTGVYTNDETGDAIFVEREVRTKPAPRLLGTTLTVSQSEYSLQLWPRLKRWARLGFTR